MTIEELWERIGQQQEKMDDLRGTGIPTDAVALQVTAGDFGETLATTCVLSRHFEDW